MLKQAQSGEHEGGKAVKGGHARTHALPHGGTNVSPCPTSLNSGPCLLELLVPILPQKYLPQRRNKDPTPAQVSLTLRRRLPFSQCMVILYVFIPRVLPDVALHAAWCPTQQMLDKHCELVKLRLLWASPPKQPATKAGEFSCHHTWATLKMLPEGVHVANYRRLVNAAVTWKRQQPHQHHHLLKCISNGSAGVAGPWNTLAHDWLDQV